MMKKNTLLTVSGIALVTVIALAFFAFTKGTNQNYSTTTTTITTIPSNAEVTILEYSDFQCPFCGRAMMTLKDIQETYGDKVEIIYKHFPLQFHKYAEKAAEASECARDQEKFWEYHDMLFENQDNLGIDSLKAYASQLGLDKKKFDKCLDSGEKRDSVKRDYDEGVSKGVSATPTFFINGKKLVGAQPFEKFKAVIDSELKG